jgi:hypothetical protein
MLSIEGYNRLSSHYTSCKALRNEGEIRILYLYKTSNFMHETFLFSTRLQRL